MWPTIISLCLALSGNAPRKTSSRRRPAFRRPASRPRVEALEDRYVPSAPAITAVSTLPAPTDGTSNLGLTVNGSNFLPSSVVEWNGTPLFTVFRDSTVLYASIPAADLPTVGSTPITADTTTFGSFPITVVNPNPGGGSSSDATILVVRDPLQDWQLAIQNSSLGIDTAGNPTSPKDTAITLGGGADSNQVLNYGYANSWSVTGGPYTVDPTTGSNSETFTFTPQTSGTYVVSFTLTQGLVSASTKMVIDVSPAPPAVNISQSPSVALQGNLDQTFGNGGRVTTSLGSDDDEGGQIFALPNGKVLVVGSTDLGVNDSNVALALLRYNADGTLDSTYQNGAKPGAPATSSNPWGVAVGPEGQVAIVQGSTLWQFNADGSPDTAFGGGSVTTDGTIGIIAFDGDKIVGAGSNVNPNYVPVLSLERYNADGSLDTSFGSSGSGKVIPDFGLPDGSGVDTVTGLTVQPNGAIVVSGDTTADFGGGGYVPFLARFTPTGSLDPSFGPDHSGKEVIYPSFLATGGEPSYIVTDTELTDNRGFFEMGDIRTQIALTPDGKILTLLDENGLNELTRFNSDGSVDTAYLTSTPHGSFTPTNISIQGDGKAVLFQIANIPTAIRYNADGSPDLGFGPNGDATAVVGISNANNWVNDGAVDSNGNIVAVGTTYDATKNGGIGGWDITLTRLVGQTPPTHILTGESVPLYGAAADPTDPNANDLQYSWSVNGSPNGTGANFTFTAANPGTYTVTLTVTNTADGDSSSASDTFIVDSLNTALQQAQSSGGTVTFQTTTADQAHVVLAAANALDPSTTPTSTIVLNLGGQTVQDTVANVPPQVTLQIVNGTFIGGSPALVVQSGQVIVLNSIFTNATDAPTILVTGGSLTLRNDAIQESTGYSDAAIAVTGGTVDLGTATDPGGNTLNINGTGAFVHNTTSSPIAAVGDTFTVNGTPLAPSSLSGIVWEDFNDDGQVDFGEKGISGVKITLTGTDDLGNAVNLSQLTDGDGAYVFLNLRPGNYTITETQPAGYPQGTDSIGTAGGSLAATDQFFVQLGVEVNGLNYNYGEQPAAGGRVRDGQTAGIGFWNNKNGQALIKALNGGTGHQLGDWLAATLPNTFGAHAGGNNLTGKSNAAVAALFQSDFVMKGVKLDAQVLATALSVYATNATLDPTKVAASYGFTVSGDGAGTATINVGNNGDVFGVANNTRLTLIDLLRATDAQAVNGVLYNGNKDKRSDANDVFSAVNQAGDDD